MFDVAYGYSYNGYTDQNSAAATSNRAWTLTGRRVLMDTTGISWHTPVETVRFWLPFRTGISGDIYAGCASYYLGPASSICAGAVTLGSVYGTAGIIGAASDALDPAGSWGPLVVNGSATPYDLVVVQQALATYGHSGAQMALLYYVR